jgi:hypothetical protein
MINYRRSLVGLRDQRSSFSLLIFSLRVFYQYFRYSGYLIIVSDTLLIIIFKEARFERLSASFLSLH